VCIGPLLFDVACCAAAACFRASDNAFDVRRLRALLTGYDAARPITETEAEQLVTFMQIAML
jgi:Ser/Thr protein kinase RdoA (MazF antagonist)